jgi:hypothetical protein
MTTINNLTMTAVIEDSSLDATLIRSLVRSHGGWKEFKSIASDISNYGANTGISFVYYADTNKAFRANSKALRSWISDLAKECYDLGVLEMLQGWRGIGKIYTIDEIGSALYTGKGDAVDAVYSTIIYAAVEDLANRIVNMVD